MVFVDEDDDLNYRKGTIGDSSDTISWSSTQQVKAALNRLLGTDASDSPFSVDICRTFNAELVIVFTEDVLVVDNFRDIKIIGSDGDGASPSWGTEVTQITGSGNSNNKDKEAVYIGCEAGFSASFPDRFVLSTRAPISNAVDSYIVRIEAIDWDYGTDTFTDHSNRGISVSTTSATSHSVLVEQDFVHWSTRRSSNVRLYWWDITGTVAAGGFNSVTIRTGISPTSVGMSVDNTSSPSIFYMFYNSGTSNIYYKSSTTDDFSSLGSAPEQTITWTENPVWISTGVNNQGFSSIPIAVQRDGTPDDIFHFVENIVFRTKTSSTILRIVQAQNRASSSLERIVSVDIIGRTSSVIQRIVQAQARTSSTTERIIQVQNRSSSLVERNVTTTASISSTVERVVQVQNRASSLIERTVQLTVRTSSLVERTIQVQNRSSSLVEREVIFTNRISSSVERIILVEARDSAIVQRIVQVQNRTSTLIERTVTSSQSTSSTVERIVEANVRISITVERIILIEARISVKIERIVTNVAQISVTVERIVQVQNRVSSIVERIIQVEARTSSTLERTTQLEARVSSTIARIIQLQARTSSIIERIIQITVQTSVAIQRTVQVETRTNITLERITQIETRTSSNIERIVTIIARTSSTVERTIFTPTVSARISSTVYRWVSGIESTALEYDITIKLDPYEKDITLNNDTLEYDITIKLDPLEKDAVWTIEEQGA